MSWILALGAPLCVIVHVGVDVQEHISLVLLLTGPVTSEVMPSLSCPATLVTLH